MEEVSRSPGGGKAAWGKVKLLRGGGAIAAGAGREVGY